jgi:hypothetical protein
MGHKQQMAPTQAEDEKRKLLEKRKQAEQERVAREAARKMDALRDKWRAERELEAAAEEGDASKVCVSKKRLITCVHDAGDCNC